MAWFNRAQKKRDASIEKRAEERKEESLLSLEMQMANGKLSYACAMALKRGKANGEVEDATEAYENAKARYVSFLNRQATDHLN